MDLEFNEQSFKTMSPMSPAPLSPTAFSLVRGTFSPNLSFPPLLASYPLDSPSLSLSTPEGGYSSARCWGLASTETIEDLEAFEAAGWSNDMHSILQAQAAPIVNPGRAPPPLLLNYTSDGESPDSTPVSSDVEDSSPKSASLKKRKAKRTVGDIATTAVARLRRSSETDIEAIEYDETDEFVRAALLEDSKAAKVAAFPAIMQKAVAQAKQNLEVNKMLSVAASALLSAFTNDDKTGRPLPKACQDLLKRATDEVALARKRQREGKSHRRNSFMHNQLDSATYICGAHDCKKRYTTAEGLRLHIRNHHDVDKKWICHAKGCTEERSFVRQADLRMHLIRMHSPVRPFPCRVPSCKKTFACHSELRRHISTEHEDLVKKVTQEAMYDD
jgi:hypothetical protein